MTFERIVTTGVLTLIQGKRLLIKDMAYYLAPPDGAPPSIAPSLDRKERGVGTVAKPHLNHVHNFTNGVTNGIRVTPYPYATEPEPGNPTIVPTDILKRFHFAFLIRHPRSSIPSYYRCTVPPLDKMTGFYDFMPNEAGYHELRRLFDYLRSIGLVGPIIASRSPAAADMDGYTMTNGHATTNGSTMTNGHSARVDICVVDADDLLDNPNGVIEAFCKSVGIEYNDRMLSWESEEDQQYARETFAKWTGFHEDALNSCDLKPRTHVSDCLRFMSYANPFPQRRKGPRTEKKKTTSGVRNLGRRGLRLLGRLLMRMLKTTNI